MSEYCDHNEDMDKAGDIYDENRPRWMWSLRDKPEETKPAWNMATKVNSPAIRTYSEGGSLATSRMRPREKCHKPQPPSHHRSKSPGVSGSTFASRARQKDPVGKPLMRSRASSVVSRPPEKPRPRTRSLSPRRSRKQSASPAPAPRKPSPERRPRPAPAPVPIPVNLYPEKERTPPPRLIPINVTEEKFMCSSSSSKTLETSWNDRYLFEPVGPSLGRSNIITEDSDKIHKQDIYKQQSSDTTFNSFLGKTKEVSQSYSSSDSRKSSNVSHNVDSRRSSMIDNRKSSSYNGQLMENDVDSRRNSSVMSSKKSYSGQDVNGYTTSSSYSSSYQKTNINGQENESSSYNENHYDSRDDDNNYGNGHHRQSINNGNGYARQSVDYGSSSRKSSMANGTSHKTSRRESRKSSSGPLPLWLSPSEEEDMDQAVIRRASQSSKKSVTKVYIA